MRKTGLGVLSGGSDRYTDVQQMVVDLFAVLKPGESFVQGALKLVPRLVLPAGFRPSAIARVAFASSKTDMVHHDDRDKVTELLEQLAKSVVNDYEDVTVRFFNCAAIRSASSLQNGKKELAGHLSRLSSGELAEMEKFPAPEIPERWPSDWKPGVYGRTKMVWPRVPPRKDLAPDHISLDALTSFILG